MTPAAGAFTTDSARCRSRYASRGDVLGTVAALELAQHLDRLLGRRRRIVVLLLGDESLLEESLPTQPLALGVGGVGPGALDLLHAGAAKSLEEVGAHFVRARFLLGDLEVEQVRFELHEGLVRRDACAFLHENAGDAAPDERAHFDVASLDRAGEHERLFLSTKGQSPDGRRRRQDG
jgi:hypothetical protein